MEVKPGYKQTEVGVIPEDWQIKSLSKLCPPESLVRGPFGGALKKEIFVQSGFKVYEQRNAIYKTFDIGSYFINQSKFSEMQRFSVVPGDFIVSCSGTIGKIYQIPSEAPPGIINQALLKIRTDEKVVFDRFFSLVFEWDQFQNRIIESTQGGAMKNLVGMEVFKKTPFAVPPLPEQRSIAEVLGDMDTLLGTLEKLIAKKHDIKQAAMQQLLTGQKRLPGFRGKWAEKRLGEIGTFTKGRGIKKDEIVADGFPCIRYGEIYTHYNDFIRSFHSFIPLKVTKESQRLKEGDLLFAGSGETAGEIGKCVAFLDNVEAYAGGDIIILSPIRQNSMYLGYLMNHPSSIEQKSRMGQGDAIVHISANNLAQLRIRLPHIEEQTAIATILSDMDAEIAALEQWLAKTRALKQGMMQELLTGRVRLV